MTPLPDGFPQASVIPNSASVRVTRPGLDFLGANLGTVAGKALGSTGGVITFNIPSSSDNLTVATANICQNASSGDCVADINVGGSQLHIDAVTPDSVAISGTVPVKVANIPVGVEVLGINLCTINVGIGSGGCSGSTPSVDYAQIPVSASLPIVNETTPPRDGYSMIDTANATVSANIDTSVVQICGSLCADIADLLKSTLVSAITSPLQSTLKNELQSQLCTKASTTVTPPCPDGTQANDGGVCVFTSSPSTCVPTLLGLDGHLDLGSLLAKYGGLSQGVDLVLAAAGNANTSPNCQANQEWTPDGGCATDPSPPYSGHTPNGLTLGMLGGMLPNPTSNCVPTAPNPLPTGIPIPAQLLVDDVTPWPTTITSGGDGGVADGGGTEGGSGTTDGGGTAGDGGGTVVPGPDLGLAIAGRFLNYAGTSAYNSGALCLGVSTDDFQALNTGYVSAIIPSIKDLTFEPGKSSAPAAMAITTRPQKPPVITIGDGTNIKTDPLLSIALPQFAIDFYVWSTDRYVRAFTYTADLTVPVNLETGVTSTNPTGGILPVIGDLTAVNGTITNNDLIWEDPTQLGSALSSLLSGIVGQFLGNGFSAINISSALSSYGIGLTIPDTGIRKITQGTDDFLAIFADLTTTTAGARKPAETKAEITGKEVHPEAMTLQGADRALFPKLQLSLSSPDDDGTDAIEYSYWIDAQPRSTWSTSTSVTVDSQYLFLQGKHVLYASARFVGQPQTEDATPEAMPFLIDVLAPVVATDVSQDGSTVTVAAYDYVSDNSALQARYRLTDENGKVGDWTSWQPLTAVASIPAGTSLSIEVQVMDEAGNVADSNGLIRGRPDPTLAATGSSSCGCSTVGRTSQTPTLLGALAVAGLFGLLVVRRRRTATTSVVRVAGGLPLRRTSKSRALGLAVGSLGVLVATSQGCSCGSSAKSNPAPTQTGCGSDCNQPCGPANLFGLIGEYTSVAVATDGTIWVAGYNDADVTNAELYGDLVAGIYDTGKQAVQWVDVDGLPPAPPAGTCPPNPPNTWRNGLTDPGPDVGLWTSIQLDSNNNPMISYYDATNAALKFASSPDGGKTWVSHTVMQAAQSDIGRYSKMLIINGVPNIAFLVIEPGTNGWARSRVVLATGKVAVPASASDWGMQDTVVDEQTPCAAEFCTGSQVCVTSTGQCQATVSGCTPADCGASTSGIGSTPEACVTIAGKPTCEDIEESTYIQTYPDAAGDYVAMANGSAGVGIVVYDRTRGNLVGVVNQSGQWNAQILDGQTGANSDPNRVDTGDVGVGASLVIASNGDWHISYVNGWTEALQYLQVPAGNLSKPLTPEVVDNGQGLGGTPYSDGQHIVGDDSSISIDDSGTVRIVYQDATVGGLLEATGIPGSGNTHTWSVKSLAQPSKFAGFFPHYIPQAQQVSNWFRATDHTQSPPVVSGDVALVAP
jgi:MYXO-CTERM domain-containing protein